MAKTLKARLSELNINSSYQLKTPRYTTDGPYKFTQDGLEEIVMHGLAVENLVGA